jgi:hypothetical protein
MNLSGLLQVIRRSARSPCAATDYSPLARIREKGQDVFPDAKTNPTLKNRSIIFRDYPLFQLTLVDQARVS